MSEQGILSFALGLEAGGFLGPLGKATDGAKAFLTAMLGIGGAVEGFKAAIEKGAGLDSSTNAPAKPWPRCINWKRALTRLG